MKKCIFLFKFLLLNFQMVEFGESMARQNRPIKLFDPKTKDLLDKLETETVLSTPVESPQSKDVSNPGCKEKVMLITEIVYDEQLRCDHVKYQNCFEAYKTVYKLQNNEVCHEDFKKECVIEYEEIAKTEMVHVCSTRADRNCSVVGEKLCTTISETVCETKKLVFNISNDKANCKVISENVCFDEEKKDCRDVPKNICTIDSRPTDSSVDETNCVKKPREVCGPEKCPIVERRICEDKEKVFVTQVPKEICDLKPFKNCINESISLPSLQLVNECVDVPKEICAIEKVNPRQVSRPVIKLWCNDTIAPLDGFWSGWSELSDCSVTCGTGTRRRSRNCDNPPPIHGGNYCVGSHEDFVPCITNIICPVSAVSQDGGWGEWGPFSECSATCGGGQKERTRACDNPPTVNGKYCEGDATERELCNQLACLSPVDGNWGAWTSFSDCSSSCGGGIQQRSRVCNNPAAAFGGVDCSGISIEVRSCNDQNCPVDGKWGAWTSFSDCSSSCGGGTQQRSRVCDNPAAAFGGVDCSGNPIEVRSCNDQNCPVDGNWGAWTSFSDCSSSCGGGTQQRSRVCDNPAAAFGGVDCSGSPIEVRSCNEQNCPVNGFWSEWGSYSACSVTCGGGTQSRSRVCNNPIPAFGGSPCSGSDIDTAVCQPQDCPIDGQWGPWTVWSSCSAVCGGGTHDRSRQCNNPAPAFNGKPCDGLPSESENCNTNPCPIDGGLSDWETGPCSVACDDESGTYIKRRYCNNPQPAFGGSNCEEPLTEEFSCNGTTPVQTANDTQICFRPYWHMIIGGSNGETLLDTVELFNWKTRKQCTLPSRLPLILKEHSGTVLDGVPIICGGYGPSNLRQKGCYIFNRTTQAWSNVSDLALITNRAGSALVPNQGWFLFGGPKNNITQAQKLINVQSNWTFGPHLFRDESVNEQCLVQLDEYTTAFLGGSRYQKTIVTFDWNTLEYTTVNASLNVGRRKSACALFQGQNGEKLVAIAGGSSQGMEVWNPANNSVDFVSQQLPTEEGDTTALEFPQLLPINNGTELLLYGGDLGSEQQSSIFKYSVTNNNWTGFGYMNSPRGEHVVLAVPGIECP